jgi:3-oxoacyl-(acyl-carrier-protein) synthase III
VVTAPIAPRTTLGRARIASLATYVPPRLLTNADLEKMVDTNDEWITQRVGIRERHVVDPGVATSDLAKEASLQAIARAGLTAADIDLIIVATTTPDTIFPSTACVLQNKIGAPRAWGFDLGAACSGFTYALTTAAHIVGSGGSRHALVVGADVMSSIIDYTDRATCVLFGDGAGAVVIEPHATRRASASSTSRITWTAVAARHSACPPAAAGCPLLARPSNSVCISSSRTASRSSNSPCGTWKTCAGEFSRATGSAPPT